MPEQGIKEKMAIVGIGTTNAHLGHVAASQRSLALLDAKSDAAHAADGLPGSG